jgi:hypothetical protein
MSRRDTKEDRTMFVMLPALAALIVWNGSVDTGLEKRLPEPPREAWMTTDKALATPVNLVIRARPLKAALAIITKLSGVPLTATRDIAEQRVSLYFTGEPVSRVMGRIQDLLGHGRIPSQSCEWVRSEESDKSLYYRLRRTRLGIQEEAAMLNLPRVTARAWLGELRDFMQHPEERAKREFQYPPLRKARAEVAAELDKGDLAPLGAMMASVTDSDLDMLVRDGRVSPGAFRPTQAHIDLLLSDSKRNHSLVEGPITNCLLKLSLRGSAGNFALTMLAQRSALDSYSAGLGLDTLNQLWFDQDLPAKDQPGIKSVDLFPPDPTKAGMEPQLSLTTALDLLAKAAKIQITSEVFLKRQARLPETSGAPEYLLAAICRTFGYDWRKVGDGYIVFSRSWAQDRIADVPEALINGWLAAKSRKEGLGLAEYIEMGRTSDAQQPTLEVVFGGLGPLAGRNRRALQVLGLLSKSQLQAAWGAEGVAFTIPNEEAFKALSIQFSGARPEPPFRVRLEMDQRNPSAQGIVVLFADAHGPAPLTGWIFLGRAEGPEFLPLKSKVNPR